MAEQVATQTAHNASDKLTSLQREAEGLKVRLEEDRQKLNDVTCEYDDDTMLGGQ